MKEKKKLKKSSIIIIILLILIVLGGGIYAFKLYYDKTLKDIKNSYSKVIITNKKAKLYDKSKREIGSINKGYVLELDKLKLNGLNKFYKIKDTDYYLNYKDVTKSKDKIDVSDKYYIPLDKSIRITKRVSLTDNNKEVISLVNTTINLDYIDNDNYYVNLFNKIYSIKKDKSIKEINNKNKNKEKETDHISVLFYENIEESCNSYSCTSKASFKDQMTKLKDNGYTTITGDDYKRFLNGNMKLKEKVVLITTNNINDVVNSVKDELKININKIEENDSFKFNSTNVASKKNDDKTSLNRYAIKSYTGIDNLLKMANGENVQENEPVVPPSEQRIAVLNYHFFYADGENCDESICLNVTKFREHLQYLKDNGFKTLTMNEFTKWMYGEIDLPDKSVLITVDDGAMGTGAHNGNKLIPLLEEYKMHATLFLVTGWWGIDNYQSPYLDVQSHTHDMHQYGTCGRGQMNCYSYEQVMADLKNSIDVVKNTDSFCFPFYMTSDTSLRAVKDSGFKIAFVGGNVKAKRSNNKWLIPRYPIHSDITLNQFINIVN